MRLLGPFCVAFVAISASIASADVADDTLQGFLTDNDPEASGVSKWKLECLDALSGRLDDREDVPDELLTIMKVDCEARFERLLPEHPDLTMEDFKQPEIASQAAEIATRLRAEADMREAEALRNDLAEAETLLPNLMETCSAITSVLDDATSQGIRLRARQPRLCDADQAARLVAEGKETLSALEAPGGNARFGVRPSERLADALSGARQALEEARAELEGAAAQADAETAELAARLEAAQAEGERLTAELPSLHEELNAACDAYGSLVSGMKPWGCVGRAQGRHRQWLEESYAAVQGLTIEEVQQSAGSLRRAENYFVQIREEIAEAMAELEEARDAQ
jgi:predicted  nucleic acid-binding Zn-ribbon protein